MFTISDMKKFIFVLSILLVASLSQAQGWGRLVSKGARKAPKKPATTPLKTISYYGGSHGALMGVDFRLSQTVSAESTPVAASVARATNRSWLSQQQRNFKAWQLKRERAHSQALELKETQTQAQVQVAKSAAPALLPQFAFTISDFTNVIPIHNQQPRPEMPFVAEPKVIAFRGLALAADGEALRHIMTNGLLLKDAGEENSTLRIAYASHGGYAAIRHFIENPVTNVTYGPQSAANWGAHRLRTDLPILTVVKIRGSFIGDSTEVVTEDIPASQIEEVIVRVNLFGTLTWCKVELNEDNTFTLTPYQLTAASHP